MKLFKRIWMGAGYLEGYGHHPGWSVIGIYLIASGIAGGARGGWDGFVWGSLFMLLCIAPIFFAGCYSRAKDYERDVERTVDILKR